MSRTPLSLAPLRTALRSSATVLGPDDAGYENARTLEAGGVDLRPGAIVRPRDADGVARAVGFAAAEGLELSVRSGGHSFLGLGRADGAVTLDLRGLDAVAVDPARRTVTVGGGVTAAACTAAAGEHGLAVPFGDTGSVGVAGITLGGGLGFLSRRLGMTVDSLRAVRLVTAGGELVDVDADHDPELFWGLRGGGGNLGVVTELTFDLHEVAGVVGGPLVLPATPASVADVVAVLRAAPRELSAIVMVMPCPPIPFVPVAAHGTLVVMVSVCFSGDPDRADAALAPLREVASRAGGAVVDAVAPLPYPALLAGPEGPPLAMRLRSFFTDGLDGSVATGVVDALAAATAPMRAVQLRVLGGAVSDVPGDATAFAHRDAALTGVAVAAAPTVAAAAEHDAWVRDLADLVRCGRPGAYVNFVPDGDATLRDEVYPGTTGTRLAALKSRVDPGNLFRGNLNVPPAPGP